MENHMEAGFMLGFCAGDPNPCNAGPQSHIVTSHVVLILRGPLHPILCAVRPSTARQQNPNP